MRSSPIRRSISTPNRGSRWVLVVFSLWMIGGCGGGESDTTDADSSNDRSQSGQANERLPDVPPMFEDVTQRVGLDVALQLGKPDDYFFPDIMCGGAAFLDYNSDGRLDILIVGAGDRRELSSAIPGSNPTGRNRLFEQNEDMRFVEVTDRSGIGDENYGMGVAVGDINNDGYPDIYFSNYGPDKLFLNQGDGTFQDVTLDAGIDNPHWSASAAFGDFNRDGWLDLYVANYVDYHRTNDCYLADGTLEFCSPSIFNPVVDRLYLNRGPQSEGVDGTAETAGRAATPQFEDISLSSGIAQQRGPGLGVVVADFDGDTWPDIYVANDGSENFLWINQQGNQFEDQASFRGCANDPRGKSQAGMGVAIGDSTALGRLDICVTHLDTENNAHYVPTIAGIYNDRSSANGIGAVSKPYTGFGNALVDVDLDGDLDLLVANGRVTARNDSRDESFWNRYHESNHLLLNDGQGNFAPFLSRHDDFTATRETSRALCVGDVNNDGRIDVLTTCAEGPVRLFLNVHQSDATWVGLQLADPAHAGRDAYGAWVVVQTAAGDRVGVVSPGQGYCSSNDSRLCFALSEAAKIDAVLVTWPDGTVERFEDLSTNQYNRIEKGQGLVGVSANASTDAFLPTAGQPVE